MSTTTKSAGLVKLTALQSLKTRDGTWRKRGAALSVSPGEATELVKAGKAERAVTTSTESGTKAKSAGSTSSAKADG